MIIRYGVTCPGCDAKIVLRVSVGADDAEPFFYVCGKCHTPTKAVQHLLYDPHPHTRLELEGGELFDAMELQTTDHQVITINPELPAIPEARDMGDKGGSSFIYQQQLTGKHSGELIDRMGNFRGSIDTNWTTYKRFARFYALQDWDRFDDHGRKLMPTKWPEPKSVLDRHDIFHRLLSILFVPILVPPLFPQCKEEFNTKISGGGLTPALVKFCKDVIKRGVVGQLHQDLIARLDFVAQNKTSMLCVLPLEFYPAGSDAATKELRLFRDEFALLKTHYIDSYELAHKVLAIIVGIINCIERGEPNSFDPGIVAKFAQNNMKAFTNLKDITRLEKLPNAPKRMYLATLPKLQTLWDEMFDSKLRNPIGHHSARHDLASGQITVDGGQPIPYLRFAFETMRLTHMHLILLQVLKMVQMIPLFDG